MQHEVFTGVCLLCIACFCPSEILSCCLGFLLLIAYLKAMVYRSLVVHSLTVGFIGWATILPFTLLMCWPRVHSLIIPGSAIAAIVTTRISNQVIDGVVKKHSELYTEPHDNL